MPYAAHTRSARRPVSAPSLPILSRNSCLAGQHTHTHLAFTPPSSSHRSPSTPHHPVASRAPRPPRPPSGSAVCPATGLSNDQAAAIAENAAAITARIDAKAARTRREARLRAAAAFLIVASVACATSSPAASAFAFVICCAASAAFVADAARASSARAAAHRTVAKARAQAAAVLAHASGSSASIASAPAGFEGKWVKDAAASDSMTPALDAVQLHGLVRRAVHLMRGVELRTASPPGTFQFAVFSALPWFRVTERYVLGGPPVRHRRRDLRRGGATGSASLAPPAVKGGTPRVVVDVAWGPPFAGSERDTYELTGPDALSVTSEMEVEGRPISYVARYRRKKA